MNENVVKVEEMNGGLRAAFVNLPHFRTTSARLTINSGSLHEAEETAGAAHFLEHVTGQGTEGLPNEEAYDHFIKENDLYANAFTGNLNSFYVADGYDLNPVTYIVTQAAFSPLLTVESLEKERNPIIDELRSYASDPHFIPNINHNRAIRGERYSRPIGGHIEDVEDLTHDHLVEYHDRNYRLGNAVLVICSSEPIEHQRELTEKLLSKIWEDGRARPTDLDLPDFNPAKLSSSLELVDLPKQAQTALSIGYELPETTSNDENHINYFLGVTLSSIAFRRLRRELALCYGAYAKTYRSANLHFDASRNWNYLGVAAKLNGVDSVQGLNALYDDVIMPDLPEKVIETELRGLRRFTDQLLQNTPAWIAGEVQGVLNYSKPDEINLTEFEVFADRVTIDSIRKAHREMTAKPPLVLATSPDPKVLEAVGNWAASKRKS